MWNQLELSISLFSYFFQFPRLIPKDQRQIRQLAANIESNNFFISWNEKTHFLTRSPTDKSKSLELPDCKPLITTTHSEGYKFNQTIHLKTEVNDSGKVIVTKKVFNLKDARFNFIKYKNSSTCQIANFRSRLDDLHYFVKKLLACKIVRTLCAQARQMSFKLNDFLFLINRNHLDLTQANKMILFSSFILRKKNIISRTTKEVLNRTNLLKLVDFKIGSLKILSSSLV